MWALSEPTLYHQDQVFRINCPQTTTSNEESKNDCDKYSQSKPWNTNRSSIETDKSGFVLALSHDCK